MNQSDDSRTPGFAVSPGLGAGEAPGPLDRRHFASDNYSGICPEAWQALERANNGHAPAYGEDAWTEKASDLLRDLFEIDCEVFFAFNGTASNSMVLSSMCRSYHSIICHELAHVETDECGGPEFFSHGTKVLLAKGDRGKVNLDSVREIVKRRTDIHYPKPKVLSLTQATELGTVYSLDELAAISEVTRQLGLHVHMDGARFANAVASLGVAPKEVTWKIGVDALCFGGTKNGMPVGDAVVFFDKGLAAEFDYRCKQAGQLASKMRFLSAPWVGMLENDVWLKHARSANACAQRLGAALGAIDGIDLLTPVQANGVFAELPIPVRDGLWQKGWRYYTFIGAGGARFMCSWDTTFEDVDELVADIRALMG
ncbi:MAG: threonine aldolase family protein [Planctomycetota bacterium]|jgi:threonine aldolase